MATMRFVGKFVAHGRPALRVGGLKWLGLYFGGIERFTRRAGAGGDGSAENGKFAGKAVDRARPKVEGHPTKDAILCSL